MKVSRLSLLLAGLIASCATLPASNGKHKDITRDIGGSVKIEHLYQENPRFLNKQIPDQYSFQKATVELKHGFKAGQKQFNHTAVEGLVVLKQKGVMGTAGRTDISETQSVKIGDSFVEIGKANSSKPVAWVKEAWLKTTLNSIFGFPSNDIHFVKAGMFGFSVGRGIALGSEYGSPKDFLATYDRSNDFSAPGILLAGDVLNKGISYAAYIGILENKSASIRDTFNTLKSNHIGQEATPWSGTGKNNTVYALSATFRPLDAEGSLALELSPYIIYNRALDQKFAVLADSESHLKTVGLHVNLQEKKNWGIDCEAAMNFGTERLYNIDRNTVKVVQSGEVLKSVYSHVQELVNASYVPAKTYSELQTALKTNRHLTNGEVFNVTVNNVNTTFRSATNRICPEYTNTFGGFMGVVDYFYRIDSINLIFSNAFGYVSGDANPHAVEANKTYRGFVAMNEFYTGKYVKSVFMLETRSAKRPLSFERGDTSLEDTSFTDLIFGGYGLTWNSEKYSSKKLTVNTNGLAFFKEFASYKVDQTTYAPTTELARKFMGTELNLVASMELVPNMTLGAKFGMFVPAAYYQDIKGVALASDFFNKLDEADTQNLDSTNYRLSNDNAFVATFSIDYKF